ncbi:hypothetical protein [Caenispirillum salinarum]|uniref:hypothetical protein n=1 Tax=Caenispirillum salinarum TaxID=859058 RepID=UPI00384DBEBF
MTASDAPTDFDAIGAAVFAVATAKGWSKVTPAEVAFHAGLDPRDVARSHPGHEALVDEAFRMIDRHALEGRTEPDPSEPVRERLFDVLMARFEALKPHREAVDRYVRGLPLHPMTGMISALRLGRSMALSLEAAGISASGVRGYVRIKGLAYTYLWVLRVFLSDDTEDLARTMAALDKALKNVDDIVAMVPGLGSGGVRNPFAGPGAAAAETGSGMEPAPGEGAGPDEPVMKAPGTDARPARTTPTGDEPEIEPGDD